MKDTCIIFLTSHFAGWLESQLSQLMSECANVVRLMIAQSGRESGMIHLEDRTEW